MTSPSRASFSRSLTVIEIGRQWAGNKTNPSSLGLPDAVTDIGHLHIRPISSVVSLIVLIQLLAAKPNKSIIIIIIIIIIKQ